MPAGDVVLVRVEPVAVTVGGEPGAHVVHGRAGLALADPDAEEGLAAGREREPALFERVGAEVLDRTGRAVVDELGEDRARDVGARELLEGDGGLDVAHAHAAVLLAHGDAEQVGLAQRVPRRVRELLGLVPVTRVGRQLALGDVAGELAQRLLVLVLRERIGARGARRHL